MATVLHTAKEGEVALSPGGKSDFSSSVCQLLCRLLLPALALLMQNEKYKEKSVVFIGRVG